MNCIVQFAAPCASGCSTLVGSAPLCPICPPMQTVGLQLTTATRAGFLIQATALLTPLLASFTGEWCKS